MLLNRKRREQNDRSRLLETSNEIIKNNKTISEILQTYSKLKNEKRHWQYEHSQIAQHLRPQRESGWELEQGRRFESESKRQYKASSPS